MLNMEGASYRQEYQSIIDPLIRKDTVFFRGIYKGENPDRISGGQGYQNTGIRIF
jgi:hypothetical protein